jgi:hypothetical protein
MVVALAALSFPALALGARAGTIRQCAGRYADVLAADQEAQVYASQSQEERYVGNVYGCTYSRHRSYLLGEKERGSSSGWAGGVNSFKLNGPIVAFQSGETVAPREGQEGPTISEADRIEVRDLRNGRLLHRVPTGKPLTRRPGFVGVGPASFIAVTRDGSVAWIAEDYERGFALLPPPHRYFEVYALDRHGERLLAGGPRIAHYLKIAGHRLTWINAGKPQSAPLD